MPLRRTLRTTTSLRLASTRIDLTLYALEFACHRLVPIGSPRRLRQQACWCCSAACCSAASVWPFATWGISMLRSMRPSDSKPRRASSRCGTRSITRAFRWPARPPPHGFTPHDWCSRYLCPLRSRWGYTSACTCCWRPSVPLGRHGKRAFRQPRPALSASPTRSPVRSFFCIAIHRS